MQVIEVIGAGGFGTVYRLPNGNVIKGIYTNQACHDAQIEFTKQKTVYEAFRALQCCDDPFVLLVNQYVRVSEPVSYADAPLELLNTTYACSVTMKKLNGIPLSIYREFNATEVMNRFDASFLDTVDPQQFEVMTHLAFNSNVPGFYGRTYTAMKLGFDNPPRGYFALKNSAFLQFLRERYGLQLSNLDLERLIGFIYGWIYYHSRIVPIDIEITLGLNPLTKAFEINVLDFGMTFDKREVENNYYAYNTAFLFDIARDKKLTEKERETAYLKRTIKDLQIDLYSDLKKEALRYFHYPESLQSCQLCQERLTSLIYDSRLFICSEKCLSFIEKCSSQLDI